jgi:hypothetical protein
MADAPAGPTMYDQQPPRGLLGCVLVPVALLAAVFTIGTVAGAISLALGLWAGRDQSPGVGIVAVVVTGLLAWFFVMVTRRLVAALRGRPVPHLFPPLVGVVIGGVVGLGCLATGIATLVGDRPAGGSARAFGIGVLFLAYAAQRTRAWFKYRAAAAAAPPAEGAGS